MKTKKIYLLLCLLLAGCSKTPSKDSSFSSNSSSEEYSEQISSSVQENITISSSETLESSSIEESSSKEESSSDSSSDKADELIYHSMNLHEIRTYASSLTDTPNEVGILETNYGVTFKAKSYALVDVITTKAGYGSRYKLLVADSTDYMYVKVDSVAYEYLSSYREVNDVYLFTGTISIYNNEVEVSSIAGKPQWLENELMNVDISKLVDSSITNLSTVYNEIDKLKLNTKGCAYSKLVSLDLKCLATDFENSNAYFTDGTYIVNLHGSNKLTNKFIKDGTYHITAALSMYKFRPGLEFVSKEESNKEITFSTSSLPSINASTLYQYTFEVDKASSYPNYTNCFKTAYVYKGYVNYYYKSGSIYLVLEDNNHENYYAAYTNARNAKALFLKNENAIKLSSVQDLNRCDLLNYLNGELVEFILFPYLWNDNDYFQVYAYNFQVISN